MDPEHRLAGYRRRADEVERLATQAQARLALVSDSATSPEGAVSITVNHAGALQELTLGPRAEDMSRPELAAAIVATARRAHAAAAEQATRVMRPLLGEHSRAMAWLRSRLASDGDLR